MNSNASMARRALLASLLSVPLAAHVSLAKSSELSLKREAQLPRSINPSHATRYSSVRVDGINVFYREAGPADAPVILLLHGYPSSSRMFEPLLPLLSDRYRLIAPDYPGFGLSDAPDRSAYSYTFDQLAQTMKAFTEVLGLTKFNLYVQDYGGPIGFRLATMHPERIQSLIV